MKERRSGLATGLSSIREAGPLTPLRVAQPEVRAAGDEGARRFDGHGAVFNTRTAIGDPLKYGFYKEVDPGAFTKTLAEGDARFLIDHQSSLIVARVSAGDLNLTVDDVGLHVDAGLDADLSYVRDLIVNLDKRRITGMSFGFYVVRDDWQTEQQQFTDDSGQTVEVGVEVRRLIEVRLLEVSAVTFPAYEETDAAARSVVEAVRASRYKLIPENADGDTPAPTDEVTRAEEDTAPAEEATRSQAIHVLDLRQRDALARG